MLLLIEPPCYQCYKGELIAVRPEKSIEARFVLTSRQNDILDMLFTQIEDDDNVEYSNVYDTIYNIKYVE